MIVRHILVAPMAMAVMHLLAALVVSLVFQVPRINNGDSLTSKIHSNESLCTEYRVVI